MGNKSKDDLIKELKALDPKARIREDHDIPDIKNMIELANLRNEKSEWLKEAGTLQSELENEANARKAAEDKVETLQQERNDAKEALINEQKKNQALVGSNKELQERLEQSEDGQRGPAKLPKFKHVNGTYEFTSPAFELGGQKYDVRDGAKGIPAEVLAHLVKIRSGVIRKIEK